MYTFKVIKATESMKTSEQRKSLNWISLVLDVRVIGRNIETMKTMYSSDERLGYCRQIAKVIAPMIGSVKLYAKTHI